MRSKEVHQAADIASAGERKPRSRALGVFWRSVHVITGIILVWLPWTKAWDNNLVLYFYPQLEPVVSSAFFKGAVLGLGIDNVLIGIHVIQAKIGAGRKSASVFF